MYEIPEIKKLRLRIAELERENDKLRKESSEYLSNWIAAQDLASWRQVLMLVKETNPVLKVEE
jgi:hypothetical protein